MWFRVAALLVIAGLSTLNVYQFYRHPDPGDSLPLLPEELSDEDVIGQFYDLFYDLEVWHEAKWMGIQTWQNPTDVWIHQEIIVETKPDVIVECGAHKGGSAALWAMILEHVNPEGRVIAIDIEDQFEEAKQLPICQRRVEFLVGSSTDPAIVAEVKKRVQGKRALVILDSDHSKAHVLEELKAYSPLVHKGDYLIVQDTVVYGHPLARWHGPGPMEALDEFLTTTDAFESDRSRERYLVSFHPKGYLKRVK